MPPPHPTHTKISSLVSLYESQALQHLNPTPQKINQLNLRSQSLHPSRSRLSSPLPTPPVFKFCSPSVITSSQSNPQPPFSKPSLPDTHPSIEVEPLITSTFDNPLSPPNTNQNHDPTSDLELSMTPNETSPDDGLPLELHEDGLARDPFDDAPDLENSSFSNLEDRNLEHELYSHLFPSSSPAIHQPIPSSSTPSLSHHLINMHHSRQDQSHRSHLTQISDQLHPSSHSSPSLESDPNSSQSIFKSNPLDFPSYIPQDSLLTQHSALGLKPRLARGDSAVSRGSSRTMDVAAHRVFAAHAPALVLPHLDEVLDGIQRADFLEMRREEMSEEEWSTWKTWIRGHSDRQAEEKKQENRFKFWSSSTSHPPREAPLGSPPERILKPQAKAEKDQEEGTLDPSNLLSELPILSSLPSRLPSSPSKAPGNASIRNLIFLPMNLLPPNLTITDLKLNKLSSAPLLTFNEMLSVGLDTLLGVDGSSYVMSLMNVEMFRDLVQMIGLIVGFGSPSSHSPLHTHASFFKSTSSNLSVSEIIFGKIPAIISLDLVGAFGKAILWFWIFGLIAGLGLYEFYRLTGGWRGPKGKSMDKLLVGDPGLDVEDHQPKKPLRWKWRESKAYITSITFLLASFYVSADRHVLRKKNYNKTLTCRET